MCGGRRAAVHDSFFSDRPLPMTAVSDLWAKGLKQWWGEKFGPLWISVQTKPICTSWNNVRTAQLSFEMSTWFEFCDAVLHVTNAYKHMYIRGEMCITDVYICRNNTLHCIKFLAQMCLRQAKLHTNVYLRFNLHYNGDECSIPCKHVYIRLNLQ